MTTPQNPPAVWYDKVLQFILSCLVFIASLSMVALILITCVDVVGRYFISLPLKGSSELTELTLAMTVFTSMPIVSYYKKHIIVDLLDGIFPNTFKRLVDIISYGSIGFMMYIISTYSEKFISRAFKRDVVTQYWEIPTGYIMVYAQIMGYITVALMGVLIIKNILGGQNYGD